MLRSLTTILAVAFIAMSAPTLPAEADVLRAGEYSIVADRSLATLVVAGPLGKISASIPMRNGRISVVEGGNIGGAEAVLDTRGTASKNSFVQEQLRGRSGLNVAEYPTAAFVATGASVRGDAVTVKGNLTMRAVTRPITLVGNIQDANRRRFVMRLDGEVDRSEFGITAGRPLYSRKADVRLRIVGRLER